jgi:hypothetical protein
MFKNLIKKIKRNAGNSLAEFAVTTAMMATLASVAAPKFAGIGEAAKEKKTFNNIDKIITGANNFYMQTTQDEGRGRFPGQTRYDEQVGGVALGEGQQTPEAVELFLEETLVDLTSTEAALGDYFVYCFAGSAQDEDALQGGIINPSANVAYDETEPFTSEEFKRTFGNRVMDSPYQDGGYIVLVIPGSGTGTQAEAPAIVVADMENPALLHKILVP